MEKKTACPGPQQQGQVSETHRHEQAKNRKAHERQTHSASATPPPRGPAGPSRSAATRSRPSAARPRRPEPSGARLSDARAHPQYPRAGPRPTYLVTAAPRYPETHQYTELNPNIPNDVAQRVWLNGESCDWSAHAWPLEPATIGFASGAPANRPANGRPIGRPERLAFRLAFRPTLLLVPRYT